MNAARCKRRAAAVLIVVAATALLALALAAALLHALAPQPGEWSISVRLGPLVRPLSMPALIRIASHPLGLALLDGRSTATPYGRWQWRRGPGDALRGVCAPCSVQFDALGPLPLVLPRAELSLRRDGAGRYRGALEAVDGGHRVALNWKARLSSSGLALDGELAPTPLAEAYAVFGRQAIPELAIARIEGRLSARVQARWPAGTLLVQPRLDGFAVSGLGTEALLDADPPAGCAGAAAPAADPGMPQSRPGFRIIGWLPHAVVAAEDQRYDEHPGYDLRQLLAAWSSNQQPGAARPQGASTLTQQLAKLLYVGDERSATRKLRELLYAVEMERTLGKGRILQLYLALAPWAEGVCGAEAAARHHLHKSAARLTPLEAAWLASLLRAGDGGAHGDVDVERVAWVLGSLRGPLPAERRAQQLQALRDGWRPPELPRHAAP